MHSDSILDSDDCSHGKIPDRRRRKTTGRSKNGCATCRTKRVKCDESRPECGRCIRLSLNCVWEQPRHSLKERRRGLGSLQSRIHTGWKPETILPATEWPDIREAGEPGGARLATESVESPAIDLVQLPLPDIPEVEFGFERFDEHASWTPHFTETYQASSIQSDAYDFVPPNDFDDWHAEATSCVDLDISTVCLAEDASLRSIPTQFIPSGIELSHLDRQAIEYFSTEFTSAQVIKRFTWSTKALLLRLAFEKAIVMRFILAASLNELSRRRGGEEPHITRLADSHFQLGCRMFARCITGNETDTEDHTAILASAFFSYLYLSRRNRVDRQRIQSLSRVLTEYVKRYDVDIDIPIGSPTGAPWRVSQPPIPSAPTRSRLAAKMMRWNFFKDVQMCFHGYGGDFATHINKKNSLENLHCAWYTPADDEWGSSYPESELIDDLQNSSTTDCLNHIFATMQTINEHTTVPHTHTEDIERRFQWIRQTYQPLFQLSNRNESRLTPMLVNVNLTVSRFHATKVYFFRASLGADTDRSDNLKTLESVQKSLSAILHIAHTMFASSLPDPLERLQWSLFMAGIETQDVIHRDWIIAHMRNSALRTSLRRVIETQDRLKHRMTMDAIRVLVRDVDSYMPGLIDEILDNEVAQNELCLW